MLLKKKTQEGEINKNSFFDVKFIDPQAVIDQLDLRSGMQIADFGCGAGYFSLPMAEKIGEEGMVYALDVVAQKLEAVASQAKTQGVNNIETKRVNLENKNGSGLEADSLDFVVMKDMLFQNKNKAQILDEAKRVLKAGGKALVIDWKSEDFLVGPNKELRMYKESLIELAKNSGLKFLKEISAGHFHYGLIFEK
jgi:ubiquinone/menaquinone biosynthesis C-methylase UbiE